MKAIEICRLTPDARTEIEKAYRRAYAQATFCAAKAAAAGYDLEVWAKECTEWRDALSLKRPRQWATAGCVPPSPKKKGEQK